LFFFRNTFAFDKKLNVLVSSLNISMALSLTLNGAVGRELIWKRKKIV
jgi:hypothetical protein